MVNENEKPEFWEAAFDEKQEMWGFEPAKSAVLTKDFFVILFFVFIVQFYQFKLLFWH
jgi:hypothetical protein